jgi:hypothetical protein
MQTIEPIHEEKSDDASDTQMQTIQPSYEERSDDASSTQSPQAPLTSNKQKLPIQIETVTEETDEKPNPRQNAEERLCQQGVFLEPTSEKPKATQEPATAPPPLPSPPRDDKAKSPVQVETATEETEETPHPKHNAEEHLNQNGAFMEPTPDRPNRPHPPACRTDDPKRATRVPKTSQPPNSSPPPDATPPTSDDTANPKSVHVPPTPEMMTDPIAKQPNPSHMCAASWTSNLTK